MGIPFAELEQLMADSAQDAVRYAQENFGLDLNQTEDSLAAVDELVLLIREHYGSGIHDSKLIFTLCNMLGAYVGEIYKANYGGAWIYDESDPQAPSVYLKIQAYTFAFAGMVYQRLMVDQNLSVRRYYEEAKDKIK